MFFFNWFPYSSVHFHTFPYRVVFFLQISVQLYPSVEMCGNSVEMYGNIVPILFRDFHRIPQKRFPYSSAEFYGNFLAGRKRAFNSSSPPPPPQTKKLPRSSEAFCMGFTMIMKILVRNEPHVGSVEHIIRSSAVVMCWKSVDLPPQTTRNISPPTHHGKLISLYNRWDVMWIIIILLLQLWYMIAWTFRIC